MKAKGHDRLAQKRRELKKHRRATRRKEQGERAQSSRLAAYIAFLNGQTGAPPNLVYRLKHEPLATINTLFVKTAPPKEHWTGAQFPRRYDAFGRRLPLQVGRRLEDELRWTAGLLSLFSPEISEFLALKHSFEADFLLGNYDEANTAYEQAIQTAGLSMWSIEAGVLLADTKGGLQQNRQFLREVLAWRPGPLASLAATHFGYRVERRVSADGASAAVRSLTTQMKSLGQQGVADYLAYRFNDGTLRVSLSPIDIIYFDSINAIVDRYLSFVRVVRAIASNPRDAGITSALIDGLHQLNSVRDYQLSFIRDLLDLAGPLTPGPLNLAFMEALDRYTTGDYRVAIPLCIAALKTDPTNLELYKLLAKACLYLNVSCPQVFPTGSTAATILLDVEDLLGRSRDNRAVIDHARKVASDLDSFQIGQQLRCFLEERIGRRTRQVDRLELAIQNLYSPRCVDFFDDQADAQRFVEALKEAFGTNHATELFDAIMNGTSANNTSVPATRRLHYEARRFASLGRLPAAIETYKALLATTTNTPTILEAALSGLYEAYVGSSQAEDALDLVIDVYRKWPSVLPGLDLGKLLALYDPGPAEDIRWVIVAFLTIGKASTNDQERLAEYLEDYMVSRQVQRPSQLRQVHDGANTDLLVVLLREICVPSVIDFSEAYDSSDELDSERLAICQALRQLDPARSDDYAVEAAELTQTMALRKVIQTVSQSKLQVDVPAIIRSFSEVFWERVRRYHDFLSLTAVLREEASIGAEKAGDLLMLFSETAVVVVKDSAELQFAQIFREVQKKFLFGESGLDTQLSVRIRHGTLQGQLRSQFETENLMTRVGRTAGHYGENLYWRQRVFQGLGQRVERAADLRLREFSADIDDIIKVVKDEWLQISGEDKPDGLFDFDYSADELHGLYETMGRVEEPEKLVEAMVAELSARRERSVKLVIERLRGDLNSRLIAALDKMASVIFALDGSIEHGEFGKAVARCRTRVGNGLEIVCAWFVTNDNASIPDVRPDLVVRTGVEVVRRGFPGIDFSPHIRVGDVGLIGGQYLRAVNDVLSILLENVLKYGAASGAEIALERTGQSVRLVVSNAFQSDADESAAREAVGLIPQGSGAGASPDAASSEGKSGYHKLHRILRHGLNCGEDYRVNVSVSAGTFVADVTFKLEAIDEPASAN